MDLLNTFLIGMIVGLLLNLFLSKFFSKRGETWATKEDILRITEEIKKIKYVPDVPVDNDYNLPETEQEFYD